MAPTLSPINYLSLLMERLSPRKLLRTQPQPQNTEGVPRPTTILHLPNELLDDILQRLTIEDILNVRRCCAQLRALTDQHRHRKLYVGPRAQFLGTLHNVGQTPHLRRNVRTIHYNPHYISQLDEDNEECVVPPHAAEEHRRRCRRLRQEQHDFRYYTNLEQSMLARALPRLKNLEEVVFSSAFAPWHEGAPLHPLGLQRPGHKVRREGKTDEDVFRRSESIAYQRQGLYTILSSFHRAKIPLKRLTMGRPRRSTLPALQGIDFFLPRITDVRYIFAAAALRHLTYLDVTIRIPASVTLEHHRYRYGFPQRPHQMQLCNVGLLLQRIDDLKCLQLTVEPPLEFDRPLDGNYFRARRAHYLPHLSIALSQILPNEKMPALRYLALRGVPMSSSRDLSAFLVANSRHLQTVELGSLFFGDASSDALERRAWENVFDALQNVRLEGLVLESPFGELDRDLDGLMGLLDVVEAFVPFEENVLYRGMSPLFGSTFVE